MFKRFNILQKEDWGKIPPEKWSKLIDEYKECLEALTAGVQPNIAHAPFLIFL